MSEATFNDETYGPVTILRGPEMGRYPDGNSVLVQGRNETVLIDPSVGILPRKGSLPAVDRILNSHCHEDHIAGNHLFPDVPWHVHEQDHPGLVDLDGMMAIYGFDGSIDEAFRKVLVEQFHYVARPDAQTFEEGDVFDLGGVRLEVIHTPGHTRCHSCFLIEWSEEGRTRRLLYLGDIELTSFGPYYGDAWSDLVDFERSLARVRTIDADWYATFHHIGVLDRANFLDRLDRFEARIDEREQQLMGFLSEPRTIDEIAEHRFVYRPGDAIPFADPVERRSMSQHLDRLVALGTVRSVASEGGVEERFVVA